MNQQSKAPHAHAAAHHGGAAIAIAGILLLMALPAFQLALFLEMFEYKGWSASDRRMAAYGGYIGTAVIMLFCVVGVVLAFRGIWLTARTGEPKALCGAAILLCLFTGAVWLMVGVAWHAQAAGFTK